MGGRAAVPETLGRTVAGIEPRRRGETRRHDQRMLDQQRWLYKSSQAVDRCKTTNRAERARDGGDLERGSRGD